MTGSLYQRGEFPSLSPRIAVVGARAASGSGLRKAHDLAAELAARGALVLSGGAIGIDAAAHAGALSANGKTVAVLAGGLDQPYPARNRPLFDAIIATGGGLASPSPDGTPPIGWRFLHRNEILAGLADLVVVVEATTTSGSLHTAKAARKLGKIVGACPGSPGTDKLLATGAHPIASAEDVLAALAGAPLPASSSSVATPLSLPEAGSDAALALAALDVDEARDVERVSSLSGLATPRAARALSRLELDGLALTAPGGCYLSGVRIKGTACPAR